MRPYEGRLERFICENSKAVVLLSVAVYLWLVYAVAIDFVHPAAILLEAVYYVGVCSTLLKYQSLAG